MGENKRGPQSSVAMRVRDYMTTIVTTIPSDARLLDAAMLIRRTGKRHVPVVNSEGFPVGIISDRDVSRVAPSMLAHMTPEQYNQVFQATPVEIAMTKDPITVTPETPVAEAVNLLYSKKIGALPVVENGKLVGILSVSDMLGLLDQLLMERDIGTAAALGD